jgi:polynucleotide 5'-kinase involved in rRNA processing
MSNKIPTRIVTENFRQEYIARVKRELTESIFTFQLLEVPRNVKHKYIGLDSLLSLSIQHSDNPKKVVVVGPSYSGKTHLLKTMSNA